MLKKKIHFVYLTICLVNGKCYVGSHSTNDINCKRSKHYMGSGLLIKKAMAKYSKKMFKRIILKNYSIVSDARQAEAYYIKLFDSLNPVGYNISPTGGHNMLCCISEETKEKIRIGNLGKKMSLESRQKISKASSGKNNGMYNHKYTTETLLKMSNNNSGENNPNYGKKTSEETKQKISKANIGNTHSNLTKEKISKANTGKIRSPELRKQISDKLKGRKISEETREKIRMTYWKNHMTKNLC